MLKRRAASETASQMRDHPAIICYALVLFSLCARDWRLRTTVTRMAIDLINRMDRRSEKQIHRDFLADLEYVNIRNISAYRHRMFIPLSGGPEHTLSALRSSAIDNACREP